ncbi:MAG: aminoacyl-tRNA hydrolase [Acidobacteria bacterium]|nr:aminoacyl-tRNA hydrolase [Acidobacteriota bacterium]
MWLIVGLGNPGGRTARTRHNVGFMVIDRLAKELGVSVSQPICQAVCGQVYIEGQAVLLAKPQTYMNRSGLAVSCLTSAYDLPPNHMLVIVDDFALPLGKLRLRLKGSDGGHNGLRSIIEALGTKGFPRLRLGIRPEQGQIEDPVDFVLSDFTRQESELVESMIERAQATIFSILREGLEKAMAKCN